MKPFAPAPSSPRRQLGAASVAIAMLLVFILGAAVLTVMNMSGSSVVDAAKNEEQVSALFLAESGLERARGILSTNPASQCNTTAFSNTPFNLGRGTFTYAAPTYTMTSCLGTASTSCCSVEVTGNIGSSSRTLRLDVAIGGGNGSVAGSGGANSTNACTTSPIATSLTNPVNAPAVLLSVFGYRQHIPGGAPLSSRNCTPPAQTVTLNSQNFESNSVALVGIRGNSYDVAALGTIPKLLQGLDLASNYSLVSVVLPGVSGVAPVKKDTYWNDLKQRPNNTGTEQVGSITGSTNSGVANNTDTCDTPTSLGIDGTFTPSYHGNAQSCHSWCYGGDTLVFSLAHGGISATSEVPPGGITFNTGGTPAQNIKMVRQVHQGVPNVINQCGAYPCYLYSDIWYAYNPDYLSNALSATSGGGVTAKAGIPSTAFSATLTSSSTAMDVTANGGNKVYVGDKIYCPSPGDASCPNGQLVGTVSSVPGGGNSSSAIGAYTLSSGSTVTVTARALSVKSGVLQATFSIGSGWLSVGDTLTGSSTATITSVPLSGCAGSTLTCQATGDYGISPQDSFPSSANNVTASGYTIHATGGTVPAGTGIPIPSTLVSVRSDPATTGTLAARSCVLASPSPTATLFFLGNLDNAGNCSGTNPATTRLVNATVCGGACAFFDGPSLTSSATTFTVDTGNATENANTHWAGGFTCLSGVDSTHITTPLGGSPAAANWRELVK